MNPQSLLFRCSFFLLLFLLIPWKASGFAPIATPKKYLDHLKKIPGTIDIEDGLLKVTDKLTIQANKFQTSDTKDDGFVLRASGNIMVKYNGHTFICDDFEYKEKTNKAILKNGKFALFPWFIGGEQIIITDTGVKVIKGYISTSEGPNKDVIIASPLIAFSSNNILSIQRAVIKIQKIPVLFFPGLSFNPEKIKLPPFSLRGGGGGFLGSYFGINYTPHSSKNCSTTLILDHFFHQGIGCGGNVHYQKNETNFFNLKSYYAHNLSIDEPQPKDRYRIKGNYLFHSNHQYPFNFSGCFYAADSWQTVADCSPGNFSLPNTGPTEFSLNRSTERAHFLIRTRYKVNNFQSINKELPFLSANYKTGALRNIIFFENQSEIGFQNFSFSKNIPNTEPFSCLKVAMHPQIYTVLSLNKLGSLSPKIGLKSIYYGKSPEKTPQQQFVGNYSLDYRLTFMKKSPSGKHFLEPYVLYYALTEPSLKNDQHYIFSIKDAFNALHLLKSGFSTIFLNTSGKSIVDLDLGAFTLYKNSHTEDLFPKLYLKGVLCPTLNATLKLDTAWIPKKNTWDHWNIVWQWTPGKNFAFVSEVLHRSKYSWLKANHSDFVLDISRMEDELLHSALSDKRTVLTSKVFLRLLPGISYKLLLRHGYKHKDKPRYLEYQMTLGSKIFEHWKLETIYEHREADNRIFFLIQLDGNVKSS